MWWLLRWRYISDQKQLWKDETLTTGAASIWCSVNEVWRVKAQKHPFSLISLSIAVCTHFLSAHHPSVWKLHSLVPEYSGFYKHCLKQQLLFEDPPFWSSVVFVNAAADRSYTQRLSRIPKHQLVRLRVFMNSSEKGDFKGRRALTCCWFEKQTLQVDQREQALIPLLI